MEKSVSFDGVVNRAPSGGRRASISHLADRMTYNFSSVVESGNRGFSLDKIAFCFVTVLLSRTVAKFE